MKKYLAFFRVQFQTGLQYRAAAFGGILTQFAWGFLYILLYDAFYHVNPNVFPMSQTAMSAYVWLYQAFMTLFATWSIETDILQAVSTGQIAYELARPMDVYTMWYTKSVAARLSRALLRFAPILIVASLLPDPYGLRLPSSPLAFLQFLLSTVLALQVVVAYTMLIYGGAFYTVSPAGLRLMAVIFSDFCAGGILPLPFFPDGLRQLMELTPFGSIQNAALRIYSGDIAGADAWGRIGLQAFWCVALIGLGRLLFSRCIRKAVVQGG